MHGVVTAASCTTDCLAPVVKVLHEGIGNRHANRLVELAAIVGRTADEVVAQAVGKAAT